MSWINVVLTHHLRDRWIERVDDLLPKKIKTLIARGLIRGKTIMRGKDRNILIEVRLPFANEPVYVAGKFVAGPKFIAMTVLKRSEARALGWTVDKEADA